MKARKRHKKLSPHAMLSAGGTVLVTLVAVALLVGSAIYTRTILRSDQMAAVISSVLVKLANEDREGEAGKLTVNPLLVAAAQAKADDMASRGYFAHVSPDGKNSWYWFKEAGYSFSHAGENLAVDFSDSEEVEEAWMDSPTHRANILNGNFTEIGIATAVGEFEGHKTTFVVQMFGTPSVTQEETSIASNEPQSAEEIAIAETRVLGSAAESAPEPEPVVEATPQPVVEESPSVIDEYATSPQTSLRYAYIALAIFLLISLGSITGFELRRHHTRHAIAFAFMIVIICGLYYGAEKLVFGEPVIATAESA